MEIVAPRVFQPPRWSPTRKQLTKIESFAKDHYGVKYPYKTYKNTACVGGFAPADPFSREVEMYHTLGAREIVFD